MTPINPIVRLVTLMLAAALLSLGGCAQDIILPVDSVCGNGVREGEEICDGAAEGCTDTCTAAEGYSCIDNICETICGDGIVAGAETCDDENNPECNSACRIVGMRPGCDMSGYWLVRQTDFSVDDVFGGILLQTSSNWYIFELTQDGDEYEVNVSRYCGIQVSGSVDVVLTPDGIRRLIPSNPQGVNNTARAPRRGVSIDAGDGTCSFSMDRWYIVRGVTESTGESPYLPEDFSANPELSSLPPLPDVEEDQRMSEQPIDIDGAEDWDGDGRDGLAWAVTGAATGTRNSVQRDWLEYFSDEEFPVATGSNEFVAVSLFDNEENILHAPNGLLLAGSVPAPGIKGQVTFRYLGQTLEEPAAAEIIAGPLGENIDDDVTTCSRVLEALPHLDSQDLGVEQ